MGEQITTLKFIAKDIEQSIAQINKLREAYRALEQQIRSAGATSRSSGVGPGAPGGAPGIGPSPPSIGPSIPGGAPSIGPSISGSSTTFMPNFGPFVPNFRGMAMLRTGGALALGALGIGGISSLMAGFNKAKEFKVAIGDIEKQLRVTGDQQDKFSNSLLDTFHNLGMTTQEIQHLTQAYINLAGAQEGSTQLGKRLQTYAGVARGFGIDPSIVATGAGSLARSGLGMPPERFAAVLSEAIARGSMQGRESELISAIEDLVTSQTQLLTKPTGAFGMMGMLNSMNETGIAGLRGSYGAALLGQLSSGIRSPGAGEFGTYYLYKALGAKDYFSFKYQQEQGATQENLLPLYQSVMRDFPGNRMARYAAASNLMNVSMHQWEGFEAAMQKLQNSGGLGGLDKSIKSIAGGKEIEGEKYALLAQVYATKYGVGDIDDILKDKRLGLGAEQINSLKNSGISGILKHIIENPLLMTEGDQTRSELQKIDNHIVKIGEQIRNAVVEIAVGINFIVKKIESIFGGDPAPKAAMPDLAWSTSGAAMLESSTARYGGYTGAGDMPYTINSKLAAEYDPIILEAAEKYRLPPALIRAVIQTESRWNPKAVSPMGAQGLMQLMPGTARELGVGDSFDPRQNIMGGSAYLRKQIDRFGNITDALRAYNAGPENAAANPNVSSGYADTVWRFYEGQGASLHPREGTGNQGYKGSMPKWSEAGLVNNNTVVVNIGGENVVNKTYQSSGSGTMQAYIPIH